MEELTQEAIDHDEDGNLVGACRLFTRAAELHRTPDTLGNAGVCSMRASKRSEAREMFRGALDLDPFNEDTAELLMEVCVLARVCVCVYAL